ncbi:alpha/beta hydrolase family protein [Chryseobacterium arthrosphaerae]|uniref:alpha/beta hydrolase family protein n=1 Tax=Chryseobacterium arthrosphaerae TaxID=651561 RepID=UPI003D34431B
MKNLLHKFICTLLILVMLFLMKRHLTLCAQTKRPSLESLANQTYEPLDIQLSPDGKYVLLFERNEQSQRTLIISETQKPFRKIYKTNYSKIYFLNKDVLVIKVDNAIERIDLKSWKAYTFRQNVKSMDFLENSNLFLVQYDLSQGNRLDFYDRQLILKQQIDSVQRWQETEGDLIVFQKKNNVNNLLEITNKGRSNLVIWSSKEEVFQVRKADTNHKAYIVSVVTTEGLLNYFVKDDMSIIKMDDPSLLGYSQISLKKSPDANAVFMTLGKRLPLDDKPVSVWYGKEENLSNYFYGKPETVDLLWYPEKQKVIRLDQNYTGYTAVGRKNLFIRIKRDSQKVDVKDDYNRNNSEEADLWNSATGSHLPLITDNGIMFFDKGGKYILRYGNQKWKLFTASVMSDEIVDMPLESVPYFSTNGNIFWTVKGELWKYNVETSRKMKLLTLQADSLEILNVVKQTTEAGINKKFQYVDDKYLILASYRSDNLTTAYFNIDHQGNYLIIPATSKRINDFRISADRKVFIWREENYNSAPVIMIKKRSASPQIVFDYNQQDITARDVTKKQLFYRGVNDEELQASLFLPSDYDPQKKYPVIVWIYEKQQHFTNKYLLPTFKNTRAFNARFLLESGYLVLMPDINYGKEGPGLSALNCINNVLDELSKIEQVNMKKVALIGQSFGGYETNFIATQSRRFASYISGSSVSDLVHMSQSYNYNFNSPDYYRFENGGQFRMGESYENNREKYYKNSPLTYASKVNAPILLWAGSVDKNVDPEETRTFFNALRKYRKTVVALFYNGEGHSLSQYQTQKDLTLRMLDWFDYFLKDKKNIPWINKQTKDAE